MTGLHQAVGQRGWGEGDNSLVEHSLDLLSAYCPSDHAAVKQTGLFLCSSLACSMSPKTSSLPGRAW